MNLDLLISKYLDGELSPDEDILLRERLKADPTARSIFDDYIEMQMDIQKDAKSIKLPEKLKRATEDAVMMEIMKATPVVIHRIEPISKRRRVPQFMSLVAALLLFFIFNIYDGKTPFESLNLAESPNANRSELPIYSASNKQNIDSKTKNNKNNIALNNKKAKNNSIINTNIASINSEEKNHFMENSDLIESNKKSVIELPNTAVISSVIAKNDQNNIVNNANIKNNSKSNESRINHSNLQMNMNLPTNSIYGDFGFANQNFDFNYEKHNVILNTIYSRDLVRSGLSTSNNTSIVNYGQSMAIEVSEKSKIGVEFGVTQFKFDKRKFVKIPAGVSGSEYNSSNAVEVLEPDNNSGYIYVPVNVASDYQMYWGTMFFERNWLNYNGLSIESRLGLGFSGSGYLAFGRTGLRYNIYSGFCITFGAEARMFSTGNIDRSMDALSNSLGLVYGIQFKF